MKTKLSFIHIRRPEVFKGVIKGISSLGGFTVAFTEEDNDSSVTLRYAMASTLRNDNYCKAVGRSLCIQYFSEDRVNTAMASLSDDSRSFLFSCLLNNVVRKIGLSPLEEAPRDAYCLTLFRGRIVLTKTKYARNTILAQEKIQNA